MTAISTWRGESTLLVASDTYLRWMVCRNLELGYPEAIIVTPAQPGPALPEGVPLRPRWVVEKRGEHVGHDLVWSTALNSEAITAS